MAADGRTNALPFAVPARFLLTGALALGLAFTALALRPDLLLTFYGAPQVLAVVHLLTLGFATMIFVGAMHQLMPVLLNTPLHSARLGSATYVLLVLGSAGIILGFALGFTVWLLAAGGVLVLAALLVFKVNLVLTSQTARKGDAVSCAMLASADYLIATALLGLLIVLSRMIPGLGATLGYATPLHLSLGLMGAFFLGVVGAGHRLLSMFVLTKNVTQKRVRAVTWLVHAALVALLLSTLLRLPLEPLTAGLFIIAIVLFLLDVRDILTKRLRKQLELPMRQFVLAAAFLPLAVVLGAVGAYPAAVYSMLGGFITLSIAGMLVKVMSFLAWHHRYAPRIGQDQVPMLKDMTKVELEHVSFLGLGLGALGVTLVLLLPSLPLAVLAALLSALGAWGLFAHLLWIVWGSHQPHRLLPSQRSVHASHQIHGA